METIPRLSYLLQRALVRIAREAQRLSKNLGVCSKQEISSALKITLCPALSDSCTKVVLFVLFFKIILHTNTFVRCQKTTCILF